MEQLRIQGKKQTLDRRTLVGKVVTPQYASALEFYLDQKAKNRAVTSHPLEPALKMILLRDPVWGPVQGSSSVIP